MPLRAEPITSALAGAGYAAALRQELRVRNLTYAEKHGLAHQLSYGEAPIVCYEPNGAAHGNFLRQSYRAILANPDWARRLRKPHTSARSALPRNDRGFWAELDSSNSSDALLMNVFCCPRVFADGRVCDLLGVERGATPEFGWRARVPLANGRADATEVDMRLGNLLVEAKLTESDFQVSTRPEHVERYRDLAKVFDRRRLPRVGKQYVSYQLIRNVLAAQASVGSFCVLFDERRPDLREQWFAIMSCVQPVDLRLRCKALTWQELAAVLPRRLQRFLEEKYGILGNL